MDLFITFLLAITFLSPFSGANSESVTEQAGHTIRNTIFVSPNGSNAPDSCGAENAPCSLHSAAEKLRLLNTTQATLLFFDGIYTIDTSVSIKPPQIFLMRPSQPGIDRIRITSNLDTNVVTITGDAEEITLDGIEFTDLASTALSISGTITNLQMRNLKFTSSLSNSAIVNLKYSGNATLAGCEFIGNTRQQTTEDAIGAALVVEPFLASQNISLSLLNCTFAGNSIIASDASTSAGGSAVAFTATLLDPNSFIGHILFQSCTFWNNSALKTLAKDSEADLQSMVAGGAVIIRSGGRLNMRILHTLFDQNSARAEGIKLQAVQGGSLSIQLQHSESELIIDSSSFRRSFAQPGHQATRGAHSEGNCEGGAAFIVNKGSTVLSHTLFDSNTCQGVESATLRTQGEVQGGALFFDSSTALGSNGPYFLMESCTFNNNSVISASNPENELGMVEGGAVFMSVEYADHVRLLEIRNSNFTRNSALANCNFRPVVNGGAISVVIRNNSATARSSSFVVSSCMFEFNRAMTDHIFELSPFQIGSAIIRGGALLVLSSVSSLFSVEIANCSFHSNAAIGNSIYQMFLISQGAAVSIEGPSPFFLHHNLYKNNHVIGSFRAVGGAVFHLGSAAQFQSEQFYNNSVTCLPVDGAEFKLVSGGCAGGHIASTGLVKLNDSHLSYGSVTASPDCHWHSGGSIWCGSIALTQTTITNSQIISNMGHGGAIAFSLSGSLSQSKIVNSHIHASLAAFGGSLSANDSLRIYSCHIGNSSANISNTKSSSECKSQIDQFLGSALPQRAAGGAIFAQFSTEAPELETFSVHDSHSGYGGAVALLSAATVPSNLKAVTRFDCQRCSATSSGDAVFLLSSCQAKSVLQHFCAGLTSKNTRLCASNAADLRFVAPPPRYSAPKSVTPVELAFYDGLDQIVTDVPKPVVAQAENSNQSLWMFSSGEVRDQTLSKPNGIFSFRSVTFSGTQGSQGTVIFAGNAAPVCKAHLHAQVASANVSITSCLPSYLQRERESSGEFDCVPCPHGSYRLKMGECVSCGESDDEEGSSTCLKAPHNDEIEETWIVTRGYHPFPSLIGPEELIQCASDSCKELNCSIFVDEALVWRLNCSCGSDNCECEQGYSSRACSKCICSDEECYFASGSDLERKCTVCGQWRIATVVSVIICLQITLVIFLLFQRNAVVFFLAEIVMLAVLIVIGVGETWLLQFALILGLMLLSAYFSSVKKSGAQGDPLMPSEHGHSGDDHSNAAAIIKIALFYFQTVAAAVSSRVWPSWMRSISREITSINLNVAGLECFLPAGDNQPIFKFLTQMALPWIISLNMVVAMLIAVLVIKTRLLSFIKSVWDKMSCVKKKNRPLENLNADEDDVPLLGDHADSDSSDNKDQIQRLSWSTQFSIIFLLSASYFELSNLIIEILRPCRDNYTVTYAWIRCTSSTFTTLRGLGIAFLLLYTVGIPAFVAILMFRNRRGIQQQDESTISVFGFLHEAYRLKWFWWEIVWFARRIVLSLLLSLLPRDAPRNVVLIVIVISFQMLHKFTKPFTSNFANTLDDFASTAIVLTLAIALQIGQDDSESAHSSRSVLILQNMAFVVNFIMLLLFVIPLIGPAVLSALVWVRNRVLFKRRHQE